MALLQSQTLSLPKLKTNNQRIPIVQHLVKDEDIEEPVVSFFLCKACTHKFYFIKLIGWSPKASRTGSHD